MSYRSINQSLYLSGSVYVLWKLCVEPIMTLKFDLDFDIAKGRYSKN